MAWATALVNTSESGRRGTLLSGCKVEPHLAGTAPAELFQFERLGYFCSDNRDCREDKLVFNRTIELRDSR